MCCTSRPVDWESCRCTPKLHWFMVAGGKCQLSVIQFCDTDVLHVQAGGLGKLPLYAKAPLVHGSGRQVPVVGYPVLRYLSASPSAERILQGEIGRAHV